MTRHLFIFFVCFLSGALITTVIRTRRHQPFAGSAGPQPMDHAVSAPMSTQTPMPASAPSVMPAASMTDAPVSAIPVNTICAICGMPVNAALPTATYHGKVIGFGCKVCPEKFAKEPDKFGPAALVNRVVEE